MGETAASLRRRADDLVRQKRYAEAATLFRREAAIYRARGDLNGAKVEETKADRYGSDLRLFVHRPDLPTPAGTTPLAKWEPAYGCYLGAFIDRDERLGRPFVDENFQSHRDPDDFARAVGKKHASVFCYLAYGRPFPARWVERLKRQNVAPHLAWEPQDLGAMRDDAYLRRFADDAARADCPIFLRFASEMNGDWTRYGGDPLRYKTAWGIVQRVMADRAPNVALVWCVNAIPEAPIARFYPGDAFVDWVGVNFYSVPFFDNDPRRSGEWANPADALRYVYARYAARKPIMVCEYGASHVSSVDHRDRSGWAGAKIAQLYAALPRLFPRVKLIDIFDMNNLRHARPGRQLNNYSVTDSAFVRDAYARAIAPPYFLSEVGDKTTPAPIMPLAPQNLIVPRGTLRVSAWARCYSARFAVRYALDDRLVAVISEPGPREVDVALPTPGPRRLSAALLDEQNKVVVRKEFRLIVR